MVEFFDVKTRKKVNVPENQVTQVVKTVNGKNGSRKITMAVGNHDDQKFIKS